MFKFSTAAIALALAITPALAQQSPAVTDPATPPSVSPQTDQTEKAADLVGLPVWSTDGQKLGIVSLVTLDADGKIESLNAEIGTFLGIGAKMIQVFPIQFEQKGNRVELTLTAQQAQDLPESKQNV